MRSVLQMVHTMGVSVRITTSLEVRMVNTLLMPKLKGSFK